VHPKLLVIGHARHGKDTVCEILRDKYEARFISSSRFCSQLFIYDMLKDRYGYANEEECYLDRHNHRAEWYNAICEYNTPNAARLGKEIFAAYDIYCGLRNKKEYHAMRNTSVFDYAIWVDRSEHLPLEDPTSMSLKQWMADFTIDNNSTLSHLHYNIDQLMLHIYKQYYNKNLRT
jgi:dephospho-CoA kinase